jgi:trk system potassium uptake protein TrkH
MRVSTRLRLLLIGARTTLLVALAVVLVAVDLTYAFHSFVSPICSWLELLLLGAWLRLGLRRVARSAASRRAVWVARVVAALTVVAFAQKLFYLAAWFRGVATARESQFYENFTLLALFLALALALLRGQRLRRFLSEVGRHPARLSAVSFSLLVFSGGALLAHPLSLRGEAGASLLDGLFTATSAVCLTGLCPNNVPATYSIFGQVVIFVLCQIGGLGYVILGSAVSLVIGKRLDSRSAVALAETVDSRSLGELREMVRFVVLATLVLETLGAVALYVATLDVPEIALGPEFDHPAAGAGSRAWWCAFHAVSAFCNCGFSLSNGNLTAFVDSSSVNAIVAGLIVLGGIGFPVLLEIARRGRASLRHERPPRLSLHLRTVVAVSALLVGGTAALLFVLEREGALAGLGGSSKLLAATFHSISMRTGGFNTVDVASFGPAAMLLSSAVMLIGGSPVSTAGGVRTTAVAAGFSFLRAEVKGLRATLFDRALPDAVMRRALAVVLVSVLFVIAMTGLLLVEERYPPMAAFFEVSSAFATCGLSSGVTAQLSAFGKVVLIVTMLVGRIGPLTFVVAIFADDERRRTSPAEERVLLG